MPLAFLPGALAALGLVVAVAAFLPARPQLRAGVDRLGAHRGPPSTAESDRRLRVGAWVHEHLPDLPFLTTPSKDLSLVGTTVARLYWDKTLLFAFGLVAPAVFALVMSTLGLLPFAVPALLGVPLGIALWFAPDRDLAAKAKAARLEFARSVAVYLELVAVERRRGAPAGQALSSAAAISESWVFTRIREELVRARLAGATPWTALNRLAQEIDVPELADVAKIVRLSGEEGAAVYETLRSRGRGLRVQLLTDEHALANQASERLSVPLTFLAFVFVGIIMTPLVLSLFR